MDRTGNHVLSMARLAKDVLAEIPDQLISYMKSRGIKPSPVPPAYSTGTQPPSNPVWAGGGGQGRFQLRGNPFKALWPIWIPLKVATLALHADFGEAADPPAPLGDDKVWKGHLDVFCQTSCQKWWRDG